MARHSSVSVSGGGENKSIFKLPRWFGSYGGVYFYNGSTTRVIDNTTAFFSAVDLFGSYNNTATADGVWKDLASVPSGAGYLTSIIAGMPVSDCVLELRVTIDGVEEILQLAGNNSQRAIIGYMGTAEGSALGEITEVNGSAASWGNYLTYKQNQYTNGTVPSAQFILANKLASIRFDQSMKIEQRFVGAGSHATALNRNAGVIYVTD